MKQYSCVRVISRNRSLWEDSLIQYRKIQARSFAVVWCSFSRILPSGNVNVSVASSPLGVINQVSSQPISAAFSFIACANLCNAALLSSVVCSEASFVSPRSFPPISSASAAAASLWLSSIRENSSSLTV